MNELVVREPDWQKLTLEWEKSGLNQREFCRNRNVSYYAFSYHRGRLLNQGHGVSKQKGGPPKRKVVDAGHHFIPVSVETEEPKTVVRKAAVSPMSEVEVQLPFGVVLRFRGVVRS